MTSLKPIGYIRNDFTDKFGIPRQSGMTDLVSTVEFVDKYASPDAFRGLEGFDYIWLIWGFDRSGKSERITVRPPRLGGNERMGVFATRSPFRPNGLGLSSVRLAEIRVGERGTQLVVTGADLADGTPIYDVKPYLAFTDSHPDARGGFAEEKRGYGLKVEFPEELQAKLPEEKRNGLKEALAQDPRPAYQSDGREYGFRFCGKEIKFIVNGGTLTVTSVTD